MTVGAICFLAAQVRAEWLGMVVATMIWGVLSRKMTRVAMIAVGIFAVLADRLPFGCQPAVTQRTRRRHLFHGNRGSRPGRG